MNLFEKLLEMQKRVDSVIKDGKNTSDKYDFASDENVLDKFRPMMDELGMLLIPKITGAQLHEGTTKSGTARYMTEIFLDMVWRDVESGEEYVVPFYSQGVDLAGEKGVGKGLTYAEKYFLLKFFHVPTKKDDPDSDGRTRSGEKPQGGTQAAKETEEYLRQSIAQMLTELFGGDEEKMKAGLKWATSSKSRGYSGEEFLEKVSTAALPVCYANLKKAYVDRLGRPFILNGKNGP